MVLFRKYTDHKKYLGIKFQKLMNETVSQQEAIFGQTTELLDAEKKREDIEGTSSVL